MKAKIYNFIEKIDSELTFCTKNFRVGQISKA